MRHWSACPSENQRKWDKNSKSDRKKATTTMLLSGAARDLAVPFVGPGSFCLRSSGRAQSFGGLASHAAYCPKVMREFRIGDHFVRHPEIAFEAPIRAPGISNQHGLPAIVVPDRHDGVSADCFVAVLVRDRHDSALLDRFALKALVHHHAEQKRTTIGQ